MSLKRPKPFSQMINIRTDLSWQRLLRKLFANRWPWLSFQNLKLGLCQKFWAFARMNVSLSLSCGYSLGGETFNTFFQCQHCQKISVSIFYDEEKISAKEEENKKCLLGLKSNDNRFLFRPLTERNSKLKEMFLCSTFQQYQMGSIIY